VDVYIILNFQDFRVWLKLQGFGNQVIAFACSMISPDSFLRSYIYSTKKGLNFMVQEYVYLALLKEDLMKRLF